MVGAVLAEAAHAAVRVEHVHRLQISVVVIVLRPLALGLALMAAALLSVTFASIATTAASMKAHLYADGKPTLGATAGAGMYVLVACIVASAVNV